MKRKGNRVTAQQKRERLIKSSINTMVKNGVDVELATQGKSISELAKSKNSHEQFKKRTKYARERKKIEQEVANYNKKLYKKWRSNALSGLSQQEIQILHDIDQTLPTAVKKGQTMNDITNILKENKGYSLKEEMPNIINKNTEWMQERYFKEIYDSEYGDKIDTIREILSKNPKLAEKTKKLLLDPAFKGEWDSEQLDDEEDFHDEMTRRADNLELYIMRELKTDNLNEYLKNK